uniref:aspartic proteinase CDR1-like n=1 Tax=Erigeron canadensis TaxID=72917 RepID=UPI001CB9B3C9|nr:aspartic proteinase CDR1-like [Erigeron canadensis]
MKTFTLLFLLITIISVCLSRPHHDVGGGGFTLDLIHRDSQLSPLYNPANAPLDRLQNAFLRSISRASRLLRRAGFASKIEADISGVMGEYLMEIQIGTPPVQVVGVADTGSDLTWAQCQPCKYCYKQTGPPFLVPSSSSTYESLSCESKPCLSLSDNQLFCDANNLCHYKMGYGDRSYSLGDLATDTFWFGPTPLKNVVFGCGHENNGTFSEGASGIVGLGGGSLSIVNQLSSIIQGKFSYCLIPYFSETTNQTSKIHFGSEANISNPNVVSTPLIKKDPPTYYYVTLESILVGNNNVSKKQSSSKNEVHEGNIIIDSGTTLTFVPREFYSDLSSRLIEAIEGESVPDPQGMFEICYKDLNIEKVPNVTFRFTGAEVVVPPVYTFLAVQKGISCFTVVPSDDMAIFGNLLQRNLLVGFDLVNQKVSFSPTDCTTNMQ